MCGLTLLTLAIKQGSCSSFKCMSDNSGGTTDIQQSFGTGRSYRVDSFTSGATRSKATHVP